MAAIPAAARNNVNKIDTRRFQDLLGSFHHFLEILEIYGHPRLGECPPVSFFNLLGPLYQTMFLEPVQPVFRPVLTLEYPVCTSSNGPGED